MALKYTMKLRLDERRRHFCCANYAHREERRRGQRALPAGLLIGRAVPEPAGPVMGACPGEEPAGGGAGPTGSGRPAGSTAATAERRAAPHVALLLRGGPDRPRRPEAARFRVRRSAQPGGRVRREGRRARLRAAAAAAAVLLQPLGVRPVLPVPHVCAAGAARGASADPAGPAHPGRDPADPSRDLCRRRRPLLDTAGGHQTHLADC